MQKCAGLKVRLIKTFHTLRTGLWTFAHRDDQGLVRKILSCSLTSKKQKFTNFNHQLVMMLWRRDRNWGPTWCAQCMSQGIILEHYMKKVTHQEATYRAQCHLLVCSQQCCYSECINRALNQANSPQCWLTAFVHHIWSVHWSNENVSWWHIQIHHVMALL